MLGGLVPALVASRGMNPRSLDLDMSQFRCTEPLHEKRKNFARPFERVNADIQLSLPSSCGKTSQKRQLFERSNAKNIYASTLPTFCHTHALCPRGHFYAKPASPLCRISSITRAVRPCALNGPIPELFSCAADRALPAFRNAWHCSSTPTRGDAPSCMYTWIFMCASLCVYVNSYIG